MLICLRFPKPPETITPQQLFGEVEKKVNIICFKHFLSVHILKHFEIDQKCINTLYTINVNQYGNVYNVHIMYGNMILPFEDGWSIFQPMMKTTAKDYFN